MDYTGDRGIGISAEQRAPGLPLSLSDLGGFSLRAKEGVDNVISAHAQY